MMYVSTFYSYKGGVGRTMALTNVAHLLALEGKRVLLVDFDLEAPGIPSFDRFRAAVGRPGLVDYVCSYRDTSRAPEASDFIVECGGDDLPPIWVMPAGRHTEPGYAEKLYSIDWKDLYDAHDGYLMFEDMRYQWSIHPARFDYVLIDSRTGHTDVGGICTRQLPDSVVVMFLPNAQNIEGLTPIVAQIREERKAQIDRRGHEIDLHFCPSNVPDLDDENDILRDHLETARTRFSEQLTIINHYSSLQILTQPAFTACRPNSKLSHQYEELRDAIIALNLADEAGAETALRKMPDRYERARQRGDQLELQEIEDAAARIAALHPDNGKIGWLLSILHSRMGAIEDEIVALTLAIERDYQRNRAIIRRARVRSSLGRTAEAKADLERLLSSGTATVFEILPAIDLLRALDRDGWAGPIQTAIDQLQLSFEGYDALMTTLRSDREKLPLALKLTQRMQGLNSLSALEQMYVRSHLILTLIGLGRFQLAMDVIAPDPGQLQRTTDPSDLFNYAVASWATTLDPPKELFTRVLELLASPVYSDANLFQCRALTEAILGMRDDAATSLERARQRARSGVRDFSCWRYLETTGRQMLADLQEMSDAFQRDEAPTPAFFEEVRQLFP